MLQAVFSYLVRVLSKSQLGQRVVSVFRAILGRFHRFLVAHPVVTISALFGVAFLFVIHPDQLPESLRPSHKCYVIKTEGQELYRPDGDTLQFGASRPCEHGQVVAFQFFNHSAVRFKEEGEPMDLVSAGIFIKDTARNIQAPNEWHEYSLFKRVNDFRWKAPGSVTVQESFLPEGCGYDLSDRTVRNKAEFRHGVLLRTAAMRSNPRLDRQTWLQCNYGTTPDKPDYKVCDYVYLELFIPTLSPQRWCVQDGDDLWVKWFAPGTRKVAFGDSEAHDRLRLLAQSRWDESKAIAVAKSDWRELSKGLPKICIRWVGPQGEWLPGLSSWREREFASVGAIWCDF